MKSEEIVKMEINSLIEQSLVSLKETMRLKDKYNTDDFSRGRYEGIVLVSKDFLDNFVRFADRIGIKLKKQQEKN